MSEAAVRAVVATRPGHLEMQRFPRPALGAGDMLLRVELCGICGSDVHLYHGHWGNPFPVILGHEYIGSVAEIGEEAARRHGVAEGHRVAVEMISPCHHCFWCRRGLYNLCEEDLLEGRQFGCNIPCTRPPHLWGGWAEYLYVPAESLVHRLPDGLPWEAWVLTEPLAVAVRAVNLTPVNIGDTAVVVGSGPIGLLTMVAARAAGAGRIILVGTRAKRLALGRELGADQCIDFREEDALARVRALTQGRGADLVFETAGTIDSQVEASAYARRGGTLTFIGLTGNKPVTFYTDQQLVQREIRLQTSFLSAWAYQGAISIIASRRFPLEKLVTHRFPLERAEEGLSLSENGKDEAIKVVLAPWD
ncbi:MAG: alcohol dehydrogenase catalytic domain-containing protein [Chloroflexi bacterium]|nr:alcohol dehydrogenase catalytic domain-containing protein [Chloroflexota bacterium]